MVAGLPATILFHLINCEYLMKRLLVIVPLVLSAACDPLTKSDSAPESALHTASAYTDDPVDAYRLELLDLAFAGVSKMPLNPHIKNRSRAQQEVVAACLELGQAKKAEHYIGLIENWQRWKGFSNLAYYYAEAGQSRLAEGAMQQSEFMLNMVDDIKSGKILASQANPLIDTLEGWRYKEVRVRNYETACLLGKNEQQPSLAALDIDEGLSASLEVKEYTRTRTSYGSAMDQLRRMAENTNFEVVHHALQGMVQLADASYDELDLPQWIDQEIIPCFKKTPVFMRVDVLASLAEVSLAHNDPGQVIKICDRMEGYIVDATLPAGLHISEMTRAIALRVKAGDQAFAQEQVNGLLKLYDSKHSSIVDIDRAVILCRMAEVYHLTGQTEKALALYGKAIVEGQVNPNSRPRADDLNAICCSMAVNGVEPSESIFRALKEMNNELGTPW